jgi:hypothetical protein
MTTKKLPAVTADADVTPIPTTLPKPPALPSIKPQPHPIVEAIDRLAEIVAICWAGYGWITGHSSWIEFFATVTTVLGVQGTARVVLTKLKPNLTASGVVSALLLTLGIASASGMNRS